MAKCQFKYLIIMAVCFSLLPIQALADPGKLVPFVSIKQEYSDNILFTSSNEEEDFITTATAGMVYLYDSERVDAKVQGKLLHLLYKDNDQLDTTDGNASASWNYQYTEKLGLGTSVQYRNDSKRDRDTDTTGLTLSGDRERVNFSISSDYMLSELTKGEVKVSYGLEEIDETQISEDNDTINFNLSFSKNLSKTFKNTIGLFNFSYLHYTSDLETITPGTLTITNNRKFTSDVFQAYTGFSKDMTELYSFYVQVGASYTDTKETTRTKIHLGNILQRDIKSGDDSGSFGGVLLTGLNYDGLYYDVGLSLSHDVRGSSGTNGTVERSSISLNINRKVTDRFYLTFNSSFYLNQNERKNSNDFDEFTINVQPGFRFNFWDTFTLSGVYRYTSVKNRTSDTVSERNLIYFVLKKDFEL